ncbi:hypothetical protein RB653_003540 [Dictyostelium firmibasis]|uniref:Uncharacterized protein n=1 Tax=Dictyostelium firmibasis TaxID=79012 RepID=A0AAN7YRQ9_9MYCE
MSVTTKFQNSKFNVTLIDTLKADNNVNIVTKNIPFLLVVDPKKLSSNKLNKSSGTINNIFQSLTKEKVSLKLVYENDLENKVNSLKTSPLDYNIYIKDQSVTVETRIQTLSSKHENNLFKIILELDGKSLYTESIRCVSKITNTVINKDNKDTVNHSNNNNSNNNNSNINKEITISDNESNIPTNSPVVKKTKSPNHKHTSDMAKTIRKLKKLRQNDKNLISLLYQQNKLITTQLNSVTSIVNTLVTFHNTHNNNNNNINSYQNMYQSPPSHEAPQTPNSFSLPPSPTNSNPPTPFPFTSESSNLSITPTTSCNSIDNNNNNNNNSGCEIQDFQFPIIDSDVLKSISTNETCYSYPSDGSSSCQSFTDYQVVNDFDNTIPSSSDSNGTVVAASSSTSAFSHEVRLIDSQLKLKSSLSNVLEYKQHQQPQIYDENIYSHPSSNFIDLDFNLLGSQNGFNMNQNEDQVLI